MIALGIDLGSAHCGVVAAINGAPLVASTIPVDENNVNPAWAELMRAITESQAERVCDFC